MILKALEIQGFKSFPDKTKLVFDKGMTAVVGPNGSGKSNIGDALRWVLGEQSSKSLRGAKMEDVIFAGTSQRKQVGFASVTLHLDNTDRTLAIESDEVSVTRKLYRNGDSEYRINSAAVRLKDILQLFMDTGLGKDGYAIVGQGKIADIVSSKSEERRQIFEEAAGISKYRYRKREAQRKLEQTDENLIRIKDIILELEERVEPLREQSEKAKEFLNLSEQKKQAEVSLWVNTLESSNGKLRVQQEKIDNLEQKNKDITLQLTQLEEQNEHFFDKTREIAAKTEENDSKKRELEEEYNSLVSKIAVEQNNLEHLEKDEKEIIDANSQSINRRGSLQQEIETAKQRCEDLKSEIAALKQKEQEQRDLLQKSTMSSDETGSEKEKLENRLMQDKLDITSLQSQQISANSSLNRLGDNINLLSQNLKAIDQDILEKEKEFSQTKGLFADIEQDIESKKNIGRGYKLKRDNASNSFEEIDKKVKQCNQNIFEIQQKIRLNEDLQKNMDGFYHSVKTVLKAQQEHRLSGVVGPVAQIINVDNKFALAIETALGNSAQHIVVNNEMVAKEAIRLLKEKNAGRSTFLPLTTIKSRGLLDNRAQNEDGAVAIASELVRADQKYRGIIENLLGRVLIATDLDSADYISKKYGHKFRIVTLDGQVINAGGSFTGGAAPKNSGLFTRKAHIDKLNEDLQKANSEIQSLEGQYHQKKNELVEINNQIEKLASEVNTLNEDKIRCEGQLKQERETLLLVKQSREKTEQDLAETKQSETQAKQALAQLEQSLQETQISLDKTTKEIEALHSSQSDILSEKEKLLEEISNNSLKAVTLEKDLEVAKDTVHRLDYNLRELELSQESSLKEMERIGQLKEQIQKTILEYKEKQTLFGSEKETLEQAARDLIAQKAQIEKETVEARKQERILLEEREQCSTELVRATERKTSMQGEFDQIVAKLWDEYEMTRSEAQQFAKPVEDLIALRGTLNKLKDKIKKMGSVNVSAIEEYIQVKERYDFMSEQLEDIEKSKRELITLITELTKEMIKLFEIAFKEINTQFDKVFKILFGGGSANLTLTNPEDVLESGIDIYVQPPGKVIKNLSLLSGGEQSFVAIAIYFAILHVRPTSFCLLDEIEAALDDVNVARFAGYLKDNLSEDTQFIVVSHRRGTMDTADVLYGVTMQEEGVSKLLKLESRGETQAFLSQGSIA